MSTFLAIFTFSSWLGLSTAVATPNWSFLAVDEKADIELSEAAHEPPRMLDPSYCEPHRFIGHKNNVSAAPDEAYAFMLYGTFGTSSTKLMDCCKGFLTVAHSIRKFDKDRPIILLSTGPPIEEQSLLNKLGVEVRQVSMVQGPDRCKEQLGESKARLLSAFTKKHVWELAEFRTVLYMEFDMVVQSSLDILFKKFRCIDGDEVLGMAPTGEKECHDGDWSLYHGNIMGNTGILLIRPSKSFASTYADAVNHKSFECRDGSQTLENQLFDDLHTQGNTQAICIPLQYNCKGTSCLTEAAVVHWSGERKPWDGPGAWPEAYPLWDEAYKEVKRFASSIETRRPQRLIRGETRG